jgi:hypothetical protein
MTAVDAEIVAAVSARISNTVIIGSNDWLKVQSCSTVGEQHRLNIFPIL